jgi:SAM-dependent methyltransferase
MVRVKGAVLDDAVLWHDLECASYTADLPVWCELAAERSGAVLELGCGTGRVALDLAARGHAVTALDTDAALVHALANRAREGGLQVDPVTADARSFSLPRRFSLVIAPMQLVQLLGGAAGRLLMLERVRRHLEPGGLLAAALADAVEPVSGEPPPLPDVREGEGWVFSSQPVTVRAEAGGAVAIDRLRQAVSPAGELWESLVTVHLEGLRPADLESEGNAVGLRPLPARRVPETPEHVGGTVVLLEAPE